MSDSEIWWETLTMSSESLAGLTNLTKGAYFEQLVAENTGGQLFDHFNNPDTDIIIDGVEFQIKATDNISYIKTVDDNIPIIATSEIAEKLGIINGGYSNEEITNSVELAFGGTVLDLNDTAIDAVLTGVSGLGILATIKGINHAQKKFDEGLEGIEAIFEGAGVAIIGTAKGFVDASEIAYKITMSKPSRFVGRIMVKFVMKLEKKLFNDK
jgi:hypothetical protein